MTPTSIRCRSDEMMDDLRGQEIRAIERYGHTKAADAEWPAEFGPKFKRWEAQLRIYERLEIAEAQPQPRPVGTLARQAGGGER